MTPLLRHIGYGMTWQHCMACVWGGLRGPLSLCLALIMLQTPAVSDAGEVHNIHPLCLMLERYTTCRLMVYAAMTPLLRHIGYGMTWQHCMACVWGGLRGPLSLCLALIMLQTPAVSDAGEVHNM
ncbi:hypothetical protein PYW07_009567 [Mythimna separata]|uniref:Secreted protein n=1 Tax=Mythimna separata TaxID=271217 RepID=A0AAD7YC36_MYTSE|nr:hypothetical protein PYW07_009567 [Mythimna separata]